MNYCPNCGAKINPNDKFCRECGYATTNNNNLNDIINEESETKCPFCGSSVSSLVGICPTCGHEINSVKISPKLKEFIDAITECENNIDVIPYQKSGWSSWSTLAKIGWVLLNLYTYCIPELIRYSKQKKYKVKEQSERRMSSLIENYHLPKDRQSVVDTLIFINSKIIFLQNQELDKRNLFWLNKWVAKAEQVKSLADISLPDDKMINKIYQKTLEAKEIVKKQKKTKALRTTLIVCGVFALIIASIVFSILSFNY